MDNKWLIVGLGNPEPKYERNRHNIGFWVMDFSSNKLEKEIIKNKYSGLFKSKINNNEVYFSKPFFYINESGIAVKKIANELNIEPNKIIVVVDDMNLDLGEIRVRTKGGNGGHNGLRSIEYELNTTEYNRLRIGIGKPGSKNEHVDYVLGNFSKNEEVIALKTIESAYSCILEIINNGFSKAMEKFN
tara:strand:+ start:521 stop:1084 length:564 start_codon:yes stop_codon:yes gene_type:complete